MGNYILINQTILGVQTRFIKSHYINCYFHYTSGVSYRFIFGVKKIKHPLKYIGLLFILLFLGVLINLFIMKIELMNYGDVGTLNGMIGKSRVFPRWFLGTAVLNFVAHNIFSPIFGPFNNTMFVKVIGSFVMCFSGAAFLFFKPNRMSLVLTVFSPIWLLFSIGYNEYYPFIAPVFVLFLLLITTNLDKRFSPFLIGTLSSIIGFSYAGFLPICLMLLLIFTLYNGLRNGIRAFLFFFLFSLLFIVIFWGIDLVSFWKAFHSTLNLSDPVLYSGQSIDSTPFFKPQFAFAFENIKRVFIEYFWTGNFVHFFIILGLVAWLYFVKKNDLVNLHALYLGLFLLYQIVYFIFMVPRLGMIQDIDLFFTIYLAFSFAAGWVIDQITVYREEYIQATIKNVFFAVCMGSNALIILYLLFLGLYSLS